MNEDMSDIMKKLNDMVKNKDMSENLQNIINSMSGNSNSDISSTNINRNKENNGLNGDIDINTILKIKSIIDSMNTNSDDPRANLLKSLKPYLKESRKDKVDQYIKIFNVSKVFDFLNPLGGEHKNGI